MINPDFWRGKRVFITGHSGFKGSWLCLWLSRLGATVVGYSLPPPTVPSLYELARVGDLVEQSWGDVRDLPSLARAMESAAPEIVIHMAAQSLVRLSYREPVETFSTNVMGTVNVLDTARRLASIQAVVVVTSDKCYFNEEWVWGYREDSRLGGTDPYSGSKGAAELAAFAFQESYFSESGGATAAMATARAGNVIGGGDWALDRLVPDVFRALLAGEPTTLRHPQATRPWQHVLEPLNGYLMLAERLFESGREYTGGWNFGPRDDSEKTVAWIVSELYRRWNASLDWKMDPGTGPPESTFLKLDASKARARLGWRPILNLDSTLDWIVAWTRAYEQKCDMREVSLRDVDMFMSLGS